MYENVFNFNSRPFTSTPFVKHYFAHESIHGALAQTRLSIDRASGPVVVVGGAGTGKTLVLVMIEEQYRSQFNVVNLGCARLNSRQALLQAVLFELDQPINGLTESELRFALIEFLKSTEQSPNGILLLIDDAHELGLELLDELRLITNFVRDGQPRVRLVMAGSRKLEEQLSEPKLESFNQRVSARCILERMTRQETSDYVSEHIDRVGGSGAELFDSKSRVAIHEVSEGCPRLVNQVCDHALILIGTRGEDVVTEDCVREAWSIVQSIPGLWTPATAEPAAESKLDDDKEWTVIEFGSLDEEESQSFETAETSGDMQQPAVELESEYAVEEFAQEAVQESSTLTFGELAENESVRDETPIGEDVSTQEELPVEREQESPAQAEHVEEAGDSESHNPQETSRAIHVVPLSGIALQSAISAVQNDDVPNEISSLGDGLAEQSTVETEPEPVSGSVPVEVMSDSRADEALLENEEGFGSEATDSLESQFNSFYEAEGNAEETAGEMPQPVEDSHSLENESLLSHLSMGEQEDELNTSAPEEIESEATSQLGADPVAADESGTNSEQDAGLQPEQVSEQDLENTQVAQEETGSVYAVEEAEDPFADSWAEEEHLGDRYAPFVAYQNQSSLSLTSSDLASISPNDFNDSENEESLLASTDLGVGTPVQESEQIEQQLGNSDGVDSTIGSTGWPASEATHESFDDDKQSEPVSLGEEQESDPEEKILFDISQVVDEQVDSGSTSQSEFAQPATASESEDPAASNVGLLGQDVVEAVSSVEEISSGIATPSMDADAGSLQIDALIGLKPVHAEAEPEIDVPVQPVQEVAPEKAGGYHEHITEAKSAAIEQEAAAILQRLAAATGGPVVSHETGESEVGTGASDREAPAEPISDVVEQAEGATALQQQNEALEETQKILDEILAQKNLLSMQGNQTNESVNPGSSPDSVERTDDLNMIVVNRMEEQSQQPAEHTDHVPFPTTPVSTGRAERMDYQQLFDQLRNASETNE